MRRSIRKTGRGAGVDRGRKRRGTAGGGGKALQSIESVAQSFKLKKMAASALIKGRPEGSALADLKALGGKLAAVAAK